MRSGRGGRERLVEVFGGQNNKPDQLQARQDCSFAASLHGPQTRGLTRSRAAGARTRCPAWGKQTGQAQHELGCIKTAAITACFAADGAAVGASNAAAPRQCSRHSATRTLSALCSRSRSTSVKPEPTCARHRGGRRQ